MRGADIGHALRVLKNEASLITAVAMRRGRAPLPTASPSRR